MVNLIKESNFIIFNRIICILFLSSLLFNGCSTVNENIKYIFVRESKYNERFDDIKNMPGGIYVITNDRYSRFEPDTGGYPLIVSYRHFEDRNIPGVIICHTSSDCCCRIDSIKPYIIIDLNDRIIDSISQEYQVDNFNRDIFKNIYLTLIAAGEDSYLYSGKMPLMIDKQNAIQTFLKIDLIFYTNNKISKCYVSIYQEKTE